MEKKVLTTIPVWRWPTMSSNMRDAHKAIALIEQGQLFQADRLTVCYVDGKWRKPSEVPEVFGLRRVVKATQQSLF